jgi:hypothetical protein
MFDDLLADLRRSDLRASVRQIRQYSSSALAIVSSDAGNLRLRFDPFEHQVVRVVDWRRGFSSCEPEWTAGCSI